MRHGAQVAEAALSRVLAGGVGLSGPLLRVPTRLRDDAKVDVRRWRSQPRVSGRQRIPRSNALVYMHIPKAGGRTFRRMLEVGVAKWPPTRLLRPDKVLGYYGSDDRLRLLESRPPREKRAIRYFGGHYGYGLHEFLPQPTSYLTLLREPVDRCLSAYRHLQTEAARRRWDVPAATFAQLLGMRRNWAGAHFFDNCQVRYLAGEHGRPVSVPFGDCTQNMLAIALERLDELAFFGLTERFDESVVMLKRLLGWRFIYYRPLNVSAPLPSGTITEADRELARSHNLLDLELYEHAAELFAERVRERGPAFQDTVRRFRRLNDTAARLPLP